MPKHNFFWYFTIFKLSLSQDQKQVSLNDILKMLGISHSLSLDITIFELFSKLSISCFDILTFKIFDQLYIKTF